MPLTGWGDFGMGLSDEERRAAMRRAIFAAGMNIQQRAGREGFGAFSGLTANIGGGLYDASSQIVAQRAAAAKAAEAQRQQAAEDEAQRLLIEKRRRELLAEDASDDEKKREVERRKAAVAAIEDPKLKGELELRIGQTNFWDVLDKKRAPAPAAKAPVTKTFSDHTTRQWDPATSSWKIVASKPAGEGKASDNVVESVIAKGDKAVAASRAKAMKRADAEIAAIVKANRKNPEKPTPVPNRFMLAKKYEAEELDAARYAAGLPKPGQRPSFADQMESIPNARTSDRGAALTAIPDAKVNQAIELELMGVPASKKKAAEAELRAAYAAGLWKP